MILASDTDKSSSIFSNEPKISITGWGFHRNDNMITGEKDVSKPAIRSYVVIAKAAKAIDSISVPDLEHDWTVTMEYLKSAQKAVWDYAINDSATLSLVGNINPNSKAKTKLVADFAIKHDQNPNLAFADYMWDNSKYTNLLQSNAMNESIFKLSAPIQTYLPQEERGTCLRDSSLNDAMSKISATMQYNEIKLHCINAVRLPVVFFCFVVHLEEPNLNFRSRASSNASRPMTILTFPVGLLPVSQYHRPYFTLGYVM